MHSCVFVGIHKIFKAFKFKLLTTSCVPCMVPHPSQVTAPPFTPHHPDPSRGARALPWAHELSSGCEKPRGLTLPGREGAGSDPPHRGHWLWRGKRGVRSVASRWALFSLVSHHDPPSRPHPSPTVQDLARNCTMTSSVDAVNECGFQTSGHCLPLVLTTRRPFI